MARYKGTVRIEESDEEARRAVMRAQARDARGQGTASATITSTMEPVDDGTRVRVETDMRITGPAAQFGRGVMQDVSAKMMGRFAECLAGLMGRPRRPPPSSSRPPPRAQPAPPPPPRPTAEVLDLGEASRDAVLKRVAPIVIAGLGLLLLRRLRRRR